MSVLAMPPKGSRNSKKKDAPSENIAKFSVDDLFGFDLFSKGEKVIGTAARHGLMAFSEVLNKRYYSKILESKEEFKRLVRERDGEKAAIPKTPRRGHLSGIVATMAMFDENKLKYEVVEDDDAVVNPVPQLQFDDDEDAVQPEHNASATADLLGEEEAGGDHDMLPVHEEPVVVGQNVEDPIEEAVEGMHVTDTSISENGDHHMAGDHNIIPEVLQDQNSSHISSDEDMAMDQEMNVAEVCKTPNNGVKVKDEVLSHEPRVTRSQKKTMTVQIKEEVNTPELVESGPETNGFTDDRQSKDENINAGTPGRFRGNGATLRAPHSHIVSTPVKPERKAKVQKVIEEQDRKRNDNVRAIPKPRVRQPIVTSQPNLEAVDAVPDVRKLRHELAIQNKETQLQHKTIQLRKMNEERELRVQRNREEMEREEHRKQEEQRKKEEKMRIYNEQEAQKYAKSPARNQPPSRLASPSRLRSPARLRLAPTTPARTGQVRLDFSPDVPATGVPARTPGRAHAKAVKVVQMSGEAAKEGTTNSPARDAKRKQRVPKKEDDHMLVEPSTGDQETRRIKREQQEAILLRRAQEEKEQRREMAEREKERKRKEIERQEQERQNKAAAAEKLKKDEERALREQLRKEQEAALRRQEQKNEEARRKKEEEELRRVKEEAERQAEKNRIPKTPVVNKHLLNASMNESSRSNSGSYEMTPDKVYKPSSADNYNIEDLSSGDETDDDAAPRKNVPAWADWSNLKKIGKHQYDPSFNSDLHYGNMEHPTSLSIFPTSKENQKPKRRRGSSATWESPIANPTKGKSRFLGY